MTTMIGVLAFTAANAHAAVITATFTGTLTDVAACFNGQPFSCSNFGQPLPPGEYPPQAVPSPIAAGTAFTAIYRYDTGATATFN